MEENPKDPSDHQKAIARKHIRGSGLLLAGRCLSLVLNFATQVVIVRYLSVSDYGAWAYCLSLIVLCWNFSTFGLKRSITRFLPIYHENEDHGKLFGTIILAIITIIITGLIITGGVHSAPEAIAQLMKDNTGVLKILLVLIFLVPLQALDSVLIGIFASFSKSRAIFIRRYIVAPGLKLMVALGLIFSGGSVLFLAYGYLLVSVIGIAIFLPLLMRVLRHERVIQHISLNKLTIPVKEVFTFTLPLFTSDLVYVAMNSTTTLMLGYFHSTEEVALFRVIYPLAHINTMVLVVFGLLYTPMAARLFAKGDYQGINRVYWQTAIWVAVLSFPVFALTFGSAKPLTVMLYGDRYSGSGLYLQILAAAYYFHVLLGFNTLTLAVLGRVRYILIINLIALIITVALNLYFIPRYGALGAAIGTAGSLVCHNILNQVGLLRAGVKRFDKQYLSIYLAILIAILLLFLTQLFLTDNIYILIFLIIVTSLIIIRMSAHKLKIEETFPELMKIPGMRLLFRS